jgi:aminomethyltransferase
MGELEVKGPDALALVQKIITNDAGRLAVNQALYSAMCDERGILLDDLVCFRLAADHFVWVVNVTKTDDDYQWVLKHAQGMDVQVRDISTDTALLALQGPASGSVATHHEGRSCASQILWADADSDSYAACRGPVRHRPHCYTGERGYEIMVARDLRRGSGFAADGGSASQYRAAGVAARESLRTGGLPVERKRHGRGNQSDRGGPRWVVRPAKDFIGGDALARIAATERRKMVGLEIEGPRTIRNGTGSTGMGRDRTSDSGPLAERAAWRPGLRKAEDAGSARARSRHQG